MAECSGFVSAPWSAAYSHRLTPNARMLFAFFTFTDSAINSDDPALMIINQSQIHTLANRYRNKDRSSLCRLLSAPQNLA